MVISFLTNTCELLGKQVEIKCLQKKAYAMQ